jgi:hypothetical protein
MLLMQLYASCKIMNEIGTGMHVQWVRSQLA